MAGLKAKEILDTVRTIYLNDPSGLIFTDAKLLPILQTVYGYLQTALERNGIQCKYKISAPITVPAGATQLPWIPSDFMWPVKLQERLSGSTDLYTDMVDRRWTPQVLPTDKLIYYSWNNEQFLLVGATTNRDVLLYYWANFPSIVDQNSTVFGKSEQYLAAKVAAVVHSFISQNMTLAQLADQAAESNLEEIIGIFTKKQMPVRRKPYIPFR